MAINNRQSAVLDSVSVDVIVLRNSQLPEPLLNWASQAPISHCYETALWALTRSCQYNRRLTLRARRWLSMASVDSIPYSNIPTNNYDHKRCGGCEGSVDDGDGIVVSFGDSYWHVQCFKCAKCNNRVSPDTNILLLSDGSPVCSDCSYNCAVCKKPISHEAIMAGDESYHAACFACKTCGRHIGELVFAKTTQGIYCMECHNERVARRKQRKAKEGSARERDRLREQPSVSNLRDNRAPSPDTLPAPPVTASPPDSAVSRAAKRISAQPATLRQFSETYLRQLPTPPVQQIRELPEPSPHTPQRSQTTFATPPIRSSRNMRGATLPLPLENKSRRRSFDDGVRPLNVLLNSKDLRSPSDGPNSPNQIEATSPLELPPSEGYQDRAELSRSLSSSSHLRTEIPRNGDSITSLISPYPPPINTRPLPDPFAHRRRSSENGRQQALNDLISVSGRASPSVAGSFRNRNSMLSDRTRAGTPMRDLPSLPQEVTSDGRDDEITDDEQPQDDTITLPLALPPMSFSDTDSFGDLLNMSPSNTIAVAPPPYTPKSDVKRVSSSSYTTALQYPVAESSIPNGSTMSSPPTLPRRNESLVRDTPNRKVAPEAIVLPDTLDSDLTYDLDDYITPGSPDTRKSAGDSMKAGQTSGKSRPGSAGQIPAGMPSSPIRSRLRSASVNAASPSTLDVVTQSRSVSNPNPVVTITQATSTSHIQQMTPVKAESLHLVSKRIRETLDAAMESGETVLKFDREFVETLDMTLRSCREKLQEMEGHFDGIRRASQQFIEGLTVAQEEYDLEVVARREAEAEVKRLKVQLSGQAARLTELLAEERKRDVVEQISRDMNEDLHGLERHISKLKAERDLTVLEVEELVSAKTSATPAEGTTLQRGLTKRFDTLKSQYRREVEPLVQQREGLIREINQLKEERNICLEETTALNARNEELVELNAQMARQLESNDRLSRSQPARTDSLNPPAPKDSVPVVAVSTPTSPQMPTSPIPHLSPLQDDISRFTPNEKKKKSKTSKDHLKAMSDMLLSDRETTNNNTKHNFQHYTVLRSRCDQCGDKMWGAQLRCTACNIACHSRCVGHITSICTADSSGTEHSLTIPTVFGRELIEQVRTDSVSEHRDVPLIVEKCISAVEASALGYEGIYRKNGGSSQSKAITQLFERGHYNVFDLQNPETYNNDISSVTSVLKSYFRQLPNPLLTHALHEAVIQAAILRDPLTRADSLTSLVYQLPSEHFHTLRYLMLHLYRIQKHSDENLMNARNLGVVFGPTLMRSSDPNREFADMAGKALAVEWLVENAPSVFREPDMT